MRCSFCAMRGVQREAVTSIKRHGKTWQLCNEHAGFTVFVEVSDAEVNAAREAILGLLNRGAS